jgi:hypothetical protein
MDPAQEFRKHADECRRMARATVNLEDRASWNRLAERWLHCADQADRDRDAMQAIARSRIAGSRAKRAGRIIGHSQHAA